MMGQRIPVSGVFMGAPDSVDALQFSFFKQLQHVRATGAFLSGILCNRNLIELRAILFAEVARAIPLTVWRLELDPAALAKYRMQRSPEGLLPYVGRKADRRTATDSRHKNAV